MEVEEAGTAKAPDAVDGDEEIDELSASFALIEASLQDQVHRFPFCYIIHRSTVISYCSLYSHN